MAQEMNTPIWEVMLQSAQVINQVAAGQRQMQMEQQRLDIERQKIEDLQAIREEKIRQADEALSWKQKAFEAEMAVKQMNAETTRGRLEITAEHYANQDAMEKAELEWKKSVEQRKSEKMDSGAARAANEIFKGVSEDAVRFARTPDPGFNQRNADLFAMSTEALTRYAQDVKGLQARNANANMVKVIMDKYPEYASIGDKQTAELAAIRRVIEARDLEYAARAEKVVGMHVDQPGLAKYLEARTPKMQVMDIEMSSTTADRTPPRSENVGRQAMAPNPQQNSPAIPSQTAEIMSGLLDKAKLVRNRTTSTDADRRARIVEAAELIGDAQTRLWASDRKGFTTAMAQLATELIGPDYLASAFYKEIDAEMKARGLGFYAKKSAGSSSTMKAK